MKHTFCCKPSKNKAAKKSVFNLKKQIMTNTKTSKIIMFCFSLLWSLSSFVNLDAQSSKTVSAKAYNDAVKAVNLGKNEEALSLLDKSINANSQFDMAYILRGKYYLAVGNKEQALKDFNQAIAINSGLGEGYACLAYYYLGEKQPQLAFDNSNKAIFLNYKTANVYYYRAQARLQNADYSNAIADFTNAIDMNRLQPDFYHDRAIAKLQLNDFVGAESDLKKALEMNSKSLIYNNTYVFILVKQKEYNQALTFLSDLIEKNSDNSDLILKRADIKMLLGDVKGAETDYRNLVEKTASPLVWTSLGNSLLKQVKYKEAIDCFEKAIQADVKFAEAYLSRGIALENLGDTEGACSDWKTAAELGDNQANIFLTDCK